MANRNLTVGEPGKVIRSYCLPLFGSVFFQQLYNLADSFVAGRFIDESALAAVGNGYEITMVFIAFAVGCSTGCSVTTARHFGAKQNAKVWTAITTALIATAAVCALLTFSGLVFTPSLLRMIHTPDSIFTHSVTYLRIYAYGLPFLLFYNVAVGIFSALGDSRTPFYFLTASSIANIILDIVFVSQLHMGVDGVAWATFLCQGAACVPAVLVVWKKVGSLRINRSPCITRQSLSEFCYVAVPTIFQQAVIVAGNMILQGVVNTYGVVVTAGYSVAVKLVNLVTTYFTTIGTGLTNYTSQNLGARLPQRVREGVRASIKLVWIIALAMCLLYECFPSILVRIFVNKPTGDVMRTATDFLRIASPFFFAPALKIMCDAYFCGAKRMGLVVFTLALDLGLRALAAVLCSALFHTALSVWFAWPIGWTVAAGITLALYKRISREKTVVGETVSERGITP